MQQLSTSFCNMWALFPSACLLPTCETVAAPCEPAAPTLDQIVASCQGGGSAGYQVKRSDATMLGASPSHCSAALGTSPPASAGDALAAHQRNANAQPASTPSPTATPVCWDMLVCARAHAPLPDLSSCGAAPQATSLPSLSTNPARWDMLPSHVCARAHSPANISSCGAASQTTSPPSPSSVPVCWDRVPDLVCARARSPAQDSNSCGAAPQPVSPPSPSSAPVCWDRLPNFLRERAHSSAQDMSSCGAAPQATSVPSPSAAPVRWDMLPSLLRERAHSCAQDISGASSCGATPLSLTATSSSAGMQLSCASASTDWSWPAARDRTPNACGVPECSGDTLQGQLALPGDFWEQPSHSLPVRASNDNASVPAGASVLSSSSCEGVSPPAPANAPARPNLRAQILNAAAAPPLCAAPHASRYIQSSVPAAQRSVGGGVDLNALFGCATWLPTQSVAALCDAATMPWTSSSYTQIAATTATSAEAAPLRFPESWAEAVEYEEGGCDIRPLTAVGVQAAWSEGLQSASWRRYSTSRAAIAASCGAEVARRCLESWADMAEREAVGDEGAAPDRPLNAAGVETAWAWPGGASWRRYRTTCCAVEAAADLAAFEIVAAELLVPVTQI